MSEVLPNGHSGDNTEMQLRAMQLLKERYSHNVDNITLVDQSIIATKTAETAITQVQEAVEIVKPKDGIYELCNTRREKLLPFLNNNNMHFEKLARSFAWEINTNDKLKICSPLSMVNAFYKCCEYGLDPASSLGQVWLIPYNGKIDLQIGYRGWLKLLFNNPMVSNVYSSNVYTDDEFSYELGMNPNISHIPSSEQQNKEKLIATYGVVKLGNGESQIRVCFRNEIDESMAASQGSHKADSPWKNHYEAMALVVPIRKMGKNLGLPLRIEDFGEASNE